MEELKDITCLIVDDEYPALMLIEGFLKKANWSGTIIKQRSPLRALQQLEETPVDLLFLDINMPNLTGLELRKKAKQQPTTIFTTAYTEHALEAFDLAAVDYLVKPFSFDRFCKALEKAGERIGYQRMQAERDRRSITVRSGYKWVKIPFEDILYVSAFEEYVRINTTSGVVVAYERMKNMEDMLSTDDFLRVHRSYIVPMKRITSYSTGVLKIDEAEIPVSRNNREMVMKTVFGNNP